VFLVLQLSKISQPFHGTERQHDSQKNLSRDLPGKHKMKISLNKNLPPGAKMMTTGDFGDEK